MKLIRQLAELALTIITMAALSVGAFAAEYCFETGGGTEYYPATSYGDTYSTAYNFGGPNPVDYQIPELPYGVSGTTQIGIMEKGYLPGLQQNVGTSISGEYGISGGLYDFPATAAPPVLSVPAYTGVDGMERKDGSIGTLKIPSLNINMKVWEGETRASMAKGLGHYSSTSGWTATSVSAVITGARNTILAASEILRSATPSHIRRSTEHGPMLSFW